MTSAISHKKPLIPGSRVYSEPLGKKVDELDDAGKIEVGVASVSYKWHWGRARYTPYDRQQLFHDMDRRYRGFISGAGAGKTLAGAAEVVRQAITQPGSTGIVIAPTYGMLASSTSIALMRVLQPEAIAAKNTIDGVIRLTNKSIIFLRSADQFDRIRGIDATYFWADEAALMEPGLWDVAIGRLRQAGFDHKAWITSTPRGFDWIYKKFASPEADKTRYGYIQTSTRLNPYLNPEFVASLEATYSSDFLKQEVEGEFIGASGLVYNEFSTTKNVGKFRDKKFKEFYYAVDFGFTAPAVILCVGIDSDNRMYVVEEWYKTRKTVQDMITTFKEELFPKYGKAVAICDSAEPSSIEELNRSGIYAIPASKKSLTDIQIVAGRIKLQPDGKPRLSVDESCINMIREFMTYRFADPIDGKEVKDVPLKEGVDHSMDAIRYLTVYLDKRVPWQLTKVLDKVI